MAVRRGPVPADNFSIISNTWLRDSRLSWKAKGLLAYIASHAPGHVLTTAQMHAEATDGPDAVRSGLVELEAAGYLVRIELRNGRGHRTGTDYELREPPGGEAPAGKIPSGADQGERDVSADENQSGKSHQGKPGGKKTTTHQKTNEKTPSATPRGTRLPEDWMPSMKMREWCAAELPAELYSRAGDELTKFRNYWCSKTGRDATKIDWDRTFQNWMINARDRYGSRPVSGPPAQRFPTTAERNEQYREQQRQRARRAQELIDAGMDSREAFKLAGEEIAQNGTPTSSPVGYIDGDVIDIKRQEEVTAS